MGRAQRPVIPVIGYLSVARESAVTNLTTAFRKGLAEVGYIEGRNVQILFRWAETQYDRLSALAADLVRCHRLLFAEARRISSSPLRDRIRKAESTGAC
jgi:hypothetical protein